MSNNQVNAHLARLALMVGTLNKFIGRQQRVALLSLLNGEESSFFAEKVMELKSVIDKMPKTYETDGQGFQAIGHLRYFAGGSMEFLITEKDVNDSVTQAFGWSNLGDLDNAELGYISITELLNHGAELDLHWTPTSIARHIEGRTNG